MKRMILSVLLTLLLCAGTCSALEPAPRTTVLSGDVVLGQNGPYDFAGIYHYQDLTIADNTVISSDGISQLVLHVEGTLKIGTNVVIRVRNGYYPQAPALSTQDVTAAELAAQGISTGDGFSVYPNTFGRGGNGGAGGNGAPGGQWYYSGGWTGFDGGSGGGGGGGGYGGGEAGVHGSPGLGNVSSNGSLASAGYPGLDGAANGGSGGAGGKAATFAQGGGAQGIGLTGSSNQGSGAGGGGGGGNGGNGGAGSTWSNLGSYWQYYGGGGGGGGGGGYGGGILTLAADRIEAPSDLRLVVGGQFGGTGGSGASGNTGGTNGQNGFGGEDGIIIINANHLSMPNPAWQTGSYRNLAHGHGNASCVPGGVFWGLGSGQTSFPQPTGISLPAAKTLQEGSSVSLTPTLTPSDVTTTFRWESSETSVATVTQGGVVTAVGSGTAVITVTTRNGLTASCTVTVPEPALRLRSVTPADGAVAQAVETAVTFTFDRPISQGDSFSRIALYDQTAGAAVAVTAAIRDDALSLTPVRSLEFDHVYQATVPPNALKNAQGQQNAAAFTVSFTTVGEGPQLVEVLEPGPGSGYVELVFTEPTYFTSYDDFQTVQLYEYDWFDLLPLYSYTHTGTGTVRISPSGGFDPDTQYHLIIPAGVLESGGIYNARAISVSFRTRSSGDALRPPTVSVEESVLPEGSLVTLSADSGASIYYTTDGSDPRRFGVRYTGPFQPPAHYTRLRAVAMSGGAVSEETAAAFTTRSDLTQVSSRQDYESFSNVYSTDYQKALPYEDGFILSGNYDLEFLRRLTPEGEVAWTQYTSYYAAEDLIELDGDILAVGYHNQSLRMMTSRYAGDGTQKWLNTDYFPTCDNGTLLAAAPAEDGFAAVGRVLLEVGDNRNYEGVFLLCDGSGNVVRETVMGGRGADHFTDIVAVEDGFLVVGQSDASSIGNGDWSDVSRTTDAGIVGTLLKFDREGNLVWKRICEQSGERLYSLHAAASPEGFLVAATKSAYGKPDTPIIFWFDRDGTLLSQRVLMSYHQIRDIVAGDGDYLAVGLCSMFSASRPYLVRLTADGQILYEDYLSYSGVLWCAAPAGQGRYLVAGGKDDSPWRMEVAWDPMLPQDSALLTGAAKCTPGGTAACQIWLNPVPGVTEGTVTLGFDGALLPQRFQAAAGTVALEQTAGGALLTWSADNIPADSADGFLLGELILQVDGGAAGEYPLTLAADGCSSAEGYVLTVREAELRHVEISGRDVIHGPYQYRAAAVGSGDSPILWSVSDPALARISQDGTLTPLGTGKVTLTATVDGVSSLPFPVTIGTLYEEARVIVDETEEGWSLTVRVLGIPQGYVTAALYDGDTHKLLALDAAVIPADTPGTLFLPRRDNVYAKIIVLDDSQSARPCFAARTLTLT